VNDVTPIYLDYNATTPIDPRVFEAMRPYFVEHFGNPSSAHSFGQTTKSAVETARQQVASLIGAKPSEIILTSGGTEASNHAIKGVFQSRPRGLFSRLWKRAGHIITSAIEHPATLKPCEYLQRFGVDVTIVGVDRYGQVDVDEVKSAIRSDTRLISIMHSNNEVGTLQPIREIARIAQYRGLLMHTDVAQSLGKLPIDVHDLGVDLLTIAGHKLYAPKGIGVLFVRDGVEIENLIHGAGHESGRRAGTESVPFIVGLGQACEIARESLPDATIRLRSLCDRLWTLLQGGFDEKVVLNGHPEDRLPNTLNVNFVGHVGAELLRKVPEIAASTGSACHDGKVQLSPVLSAMGVPSAMGQGAVRFSVGRFTTEEEIDNAVEILVERSK